LGGKGAGGKKKIEMGGVVEKVFKTSKYWISKKKQTNLREREKIACEKRGKKEKTE